MTIPDTTPGLFVVFEGDDGVGKFTQVMELVTRFQNRCIEPALTRQPSGTLIGARLCKLLLDPGHPELVTRTEALVYAADKAQYVEEVILPALARGGVVVYNRYADSVVAYQEAGRVLNLTEAEQVAHQMTGGLRPDLTVLLDIDPTGVVASIRQQDRLEVAGLEFHRHAHGRFLRLASEDPERYLILDAHGLRENIAEKVTEKAFALLN